MDDPERVVKHINSLRNVFKNFKIKGFQNTKFMFRL